MSGFNNKHIFLSSGGQNIQSKVPKYFVSGKGPLFSWFADCCLLAVALYSSHRALSCLSSSYKKCSHHGGSTHITSPKFHYILNATSANTITLEIRVSPCKFGRHTSIQSITCVCVYIHTHMWNYKYDLWWGESSRKESTDYAREICF